MKFIILFFLLSSIFIIRAYSAPHYAHYAKIYRLKTADTIIQLDSVKDKKLYKKKKVRLKDTVNVKPGKGLRDTTKKRNQAGSDFEVKYTSKDSMRADNENKILYLYGGARVTYEDFELDADFIKVDQKNHLVYASGLTDRKTKRYNGRPIFKQGKDKPVLADSLVFNYVTKKGKIYNIASDQDGDYLSGGKAKRLNDEEVAYSNVLFSTCSLPYPDTHFGIVITKGIAEKNTIISGPAYLEIEGVPLPLAIPFGFFPKPDHRQSGVILPTAGEDAQLGFFLRDFGYYLGLSEYADLTTLGTYYTKGSYDLTSTLDYFKRYNYRGTLTLSYLSHKLGLETDPPSRAFNIRWNHSQDPASNPGTTFSASVNAGTSSYYQNAGAAVGYNLTTLTQNQLASSVAYSKTWPGSPFNFTANLTDNENITAKTVTLTLPSFSFNMTTLSPFDSKDRIGDQRWYQRITVGYSLQGTNSLNNIQESQLFTSHTLSKSLQNGLEQTIPIGLNLPVFRYFQFSGNINYIERDYLQSIRQHYARGSISGADSLVTDTVQGFKRAGEYNISAGFSTKLYSEIDFKSGSLRKIRDVITPNVSFNYRPDFSDPKYGYYNTIVSNATIPYPYTTTTYSIFQQNVYGGPAGGKSAGLSFSLDNTIEAKLKARASDTSGNERKISILQGLSFATFYNFLADSLKLSPITFSGRTALFNKKVGVSFSGVLNPYVNVVRDSVSNGQVVRYSNIINRYTIQDGRLPTLTSFNLSMDFSLNSNSVKKNAVNTPPPPNTLGNMTPTQAQKLALINSDPEAFVDFNIPWNISMSYSFYYTNTGVITTTTNTVNFSGSVTVTPKWNVRYTSGFDLQQAKLTATSLSITRDLHCWDMAIQWIPFGYYKFYSVDIKVKASILQSLKLSKRRDYYNTN